MNSNYAIVAVSLLGAALRFYDLATESLWLDEGFVYARIIEPYAAAITHWDVRWQGSLFAVIEKSWCDLFGHSEYSLRFLPALFGSLAVPALYSLGQRLFSRRVGLTAALLLAVNPFAIHFSQDARPYTLFLLASILATLFAVRALRGDSGKPWTPFLIFSIVALYSHPFGVFLLPFLITLPYLLPRESSSSSSKRTYFKTVAWAGVVYLPMMAVFAMTMVGKIHGRLHDADFIPPATLALFADTFSKYFMSSAAALVAGGIAALALVTGVYRRSIPVSLRIPVLFAVCFLVVPWLVSLVITPIYFFRYTIPAVAAVLLILGWATESLKPPLRIAFLVILVALSGNSLYDYYTKVDKDPWRQTAERLQLRMNPDDLIIVHPFWAARPLSYYLSEEDSIELYAQEDFSDLQSRMSSSPRFWIVSTYDIKNMSLQEILSTANSVGTVETTIDVLDSLEINPRAYKVARIRASLYTQKSQAEIGAREAGGQLKMPNHRLESFPVFD